MVEVKELIEVAKRDGKRDWLRAVDRVQRGHLLSVDELEID